jgi:hypothetical protein
MSISFFLFSLILLLKPIENFLLNLSFLNKGDIYLTLASINGVFFSIFFSIVLVAVQHSATNYMPSILETFRKDKRLLFIVILSLLSILVNLLFYLSDVTPLFFLSFLIFLMSFLSIIFYFYEMLNFLNPLFLVNSLKEDIIKKMDKIKNKTIKQTHKEIKGTFLEKFSPFVKEANLNSGKYQNKNIEEIGKLFNHIERSNAINDFETYKKSLENLFQVVNYYFSHKRVDTQNDEFISYVLTKLKLQADALIMKNEHFKLIEIIKILENMAVSSINHLDIIPTQRFTFIAVLISDSIKEIGTKSVVARNLDLAKECILSIRKIGMKSIDKNLNLSMTEESIKEISIVSNDWFIYHNALASINILLCSLVENMLKKENSKKIIPSFEISRLIEIQTDLLINSIKGYRGSLSTETATSPFFGFLSEVRLSKIIARIILMAQNPPVELATLKYETLAKKTIGDIFENQKKIIGIAKTNNANITLINYTNEFLEIFKLLNKIQLKTYKEGFKEERELLKDLILSCYKDDHTFNMLKITIKNYIDVLSYQDKKLNKEIIDEINNILKKLEKNQKNF